MTYSFDYKEYQYEVTFTEEINEINVNIYNKKDLSFCTYVYYFEKKELYESLNYESFDKCKKGDSCYTSWDEIVKYIIDNM